MKRTLTAGLILIFLMGSAFAQDKPKVEGEIKGRILDYETQAPLAGVIVAVKNTDLKDLSDASGEYSFSGVPAGFHVLTFQMDGYYTDTRTDVNVRPGRTSFINVEMLLVRVLKEEVRVTADYFPATPDKPGSQIQFNAEELRRDAGASGDVSRALFSVPGIMKADEISNDLIVRGGSPVENGFYIDNIFVPNINHFPQWGASGGNISMLNMDFIDRLQVFTGGFDVSYGNRLSSIFDIGFREGNRQRVNGQLNLSILGYGAQVEGPFPRGKGAWMISANKSYLEIIQYALGDTGYPSYGDVQGKMTYDLNANDRLSFLGIVGRSGTTEDREEERLDGKYDYGAEKFLVATAGLTWRHVWNQNGWSDTSVSYSSIDGREDNWKIEDDSSLTFFDYRQQWLTFRNVNQLHLAPSHQLRFGVEGQWIDFRNHDSSDEAASQLDGTSGAGFVSYVFHPLSNLSLSTGLRLDYVPFSERFHLSPRLSFSWVLTRRLSVNGGFGMFFQQMPLHILNQNPGNIQLQDMQARHLILGLKFLLRHDTQLILEAYDKQYDHFPMSGYAPYFFVIDDVSGDDAKFSHWGPLVDQGRAYVRGVELTLQKKLAQSLYGLVSLTYFRTKYRDLMGVWRNRLYDSRFILVVSGGYKPTRYWDFNLRWIWMGNKAYTPVNEQKSIQYGYPWVDYADIMGGHLPNYLNLSMRIDRRFYFSRSNLVVFWGAWNMFNHQNELDRYWNSSLNAYQSEYMWGLIPFIGIEFEF